MTPAGRALPRLVRTAEIVAAYVAHNPVHADAIPTVIATVHGALSDLERPLTLPAPLHAATPGPRPMAVSARPRRPRPTTIQRRMRDHLRVVAANE